MPTTAQTALIKIAAAHGNLAIAGDDGLSVLVFSDTVNTATGEEGCTTDIVTTKAGLYALLGY